MAKKMTSPAIRIHCNRWDNWYGYRAGKRVIAFANTPTGTAEQNARAWEDNQITTTLDLLAELDRVIEGCKEDLCDEVWEMESGNVTWQGVLNGLMDNDDFTNAVSRLVSFELGIDTDEMTDEQESASMYRQNGYFGEVADTLVKAVNKMFRQMKAMK